VPGKCRGRAEVAESGLCHGGLYCAVDLVADAVEPVLVTVEDPAVAYAAPGVVGRGADEQMRVAEHDDLGVGRRRPDRREDLGHAAAAGRVGEGRHAASALDAVT
jgi:hypothetical protein